MKRRPQLVVESTPQTFGGLPVPELVSACGYNAAARFAAYFSLRVSDVEARRLYSRAIGRFSDWMGIHEYRLWSFSPVLLSAYLEMQAIEGATLSDVRTDWRALRVLFDWFDSVGLVHMNVGAAVADPLHGFATDQDASSNKPSATEVSATLVG